MTSNPKAPTALSIELVGETWEVETDQDMTFGRDADIIVDTNPYLHRRAGMFRFHDGAWWLHNIGSAISIEICDEMSPSRMTVTPGASVPIPFRESLVRFQAGSSVYELEVNLESAASLATIDRGDDGDPTITASDVPLNAEQRLLIVALAERRLRDRGAPVSDIPPNRAAADRLGWSITKFNRKLDNLCSKFDRLGVAGMKGDLGGLASNRRERLVDHAVTVGIVSPDDLPMLETITS